MTARVGFSYDRPPVPEQWERELFHIAPPSEQLTWLKLWYVTGDAWQPINRWCIYQMRAPRLIANRVDLVRELRGPHPRSMGHYCSNDSWSQCGISQCRRSVRQSMNAWVGGAARQISRDT